MKIYYVKKSKNSLGYHEVHTSDCSDLNDFVNEMYLGAFMNCLDALEAARKHYANVSGCLQCVKEKSIY
jgi:molecular chaperone GrpE (heat shock protein)